MEGLYRNNSSKASKLKTLDGNISPINVKRDNHQIFPGGGRYHRPSKSPSFDSYASVDDSNLQNFDSTLIRYLRSVSPAASGGDSFKTPSVGSSMYRQMVGNEYVRSNSNTSGGSSGFGSRGTSPLSSVENLESPPSRSPSMFSSPLKVEEDVVVMDGVLVASLPGARVRSSMSSESGSSSSGSNSHYKTEICRPWVDSGSCRYGSKCQFAHGKEELRPTRFLNKNKSEAQTCKSYAGSGSCTYGSKCRFLHHQLSKIASPPPTEPAAARAMSKSQRVTPTKPEHANGSSITSTSTDWSPRDDGIDIALPSSASADKSPSREDVDAYIQSALYGPIRRKRLPVFDEICPE